jgi:hypothetical protein
MQDTLPLQKQKIHSWAEDTHSLPSLLQGSSSLIGFMIGPNPGFSGGTLARGVFPFYTQVLWVK